MQFNTIEYQIADSILTLTLNRPDQLNSFTVEMANELVDAFNYASDDDAVRVIVVTGAGKAFCAGMDLTRAGNVFGLQEDLSPTLQDMHERLEDPQMIDGVRDTGGRVTLAIYDCKKPVIAAINGAAVGIGATMTCAMDIRMASEKARIGFVFNKIGITPEACSTWFLPRIVGMSKALEWSYTGEILDAAAALEGRFVRSVSAPENLLSDAYELAARIAQHSPVALALTRQMMYRNSVKDHPIEAHRIDSLAMYHVSQHDGKEGVQSFLEKRPARFKAKASSDMPDFYPWWD
ncbi:MAG: crotonase/enoyl-CoA hydratase family protein [Gammaproteobacteria bacterium]|nr:crotonase/enoyl-CoA hydratase family protein [Gammaproteobacteria bacterium]